MNIKAKLRCSRVTVNPATEYSSTSENVQLDAVYSEDPSSENYSFSTATPSAILTMHISNPDALGAFEEGKEYYLDFTPAN